MKRIFTFFLGILIAAVAYSEQPQGTIMKASVAPVIDGLLDEVWEEAEVYNIDKPYRTETPTLGEEGETTWRGLWNEDGMYIFLTVADDNWYPSYKTGGNNWEYDKPEIYLDVNYILEDGLGAQHGQGHYQVAPAAAAATIDGTAITQGNGVVYAFLVEDPKYTAEYFIPWSLLNDKDGNPVDLTNPVGFDVTIIDRDEGDSGRRRAVWANTGNKDESWSNMDDAGIIYFDGAEAPVYIEEIILSAEQTTITEDNQTLQIQAEVLPENATNKTVKWKVVPAEGSNARATISNTGLLTPIADGVVIVSASSMDDFIESNEIEITISGQIVTEMELNVIRNGDFSQVNADGTATHWGGWGGDANSPMPQVINGVAVATPVQTANVWQYQFSQSNLNALPNIPYVFKFKAWADAPRTFNVDFEDTAGNSYNRYGSTGDARSADGRSDWTFDVTTEPTWYEFDVVFDQILPTTIQKVQYMLGLSSVVTYIDSVILISEADMALLPTSVNEISRESFRVYPNPAVTTLTVEVPVANSRVAIYNSLGVKMAEVVVPGTRYEFDVRNFKSGLYFVRTRDSVVKFVK
jgi:hypothetical protein